MMKETQRPPAKQQPQLGEKTDLFKLQNQFLFKFHKELRHKGEADDIVDEAKNLKKSKQQRFVEILQYCILVAKMKHA